MEKDIKPERVANAILMRFNKKKYYLMVEGSKDYKLYSKFFDKNKVCIEECFGCINLVEVLKILRLRGYQNNIGIIDSDFRRILSLEESLDGLFLTDLHDMEVQMILSEAFDNSIRKYTRDEKIKKFEEEKSNSIREIIFDLGMQIGLLKLANKLHGLGLVFKPKQVDGNQIKYREFINEKNMEYLGNKKMIKTVVNYSRNRTGCVLSEEVILEKLNETAKCTYDLFQLINGHDLSNIMYLFLKKTMSTTKSIDSFNDFEDDLILAYEYDDFKRTNLYRSISLYRSDEINFFK